MPSSIASLNRRIKALEADLDDAMSFAAVPIYRCPQCHRLALSKGWCCFNCGYDSAYPVNPDWKKEKAK